MSEPNKGGRPSIQIDQKTRNTVTALIGVGMGIEMVAKVIGISPASVKRHFKAEIKTGAAKLEGLCVSTIVANLAKGGSVGQRAAEFLLHTRFNWSKYAPQAPAREPDMGKKEALNRAAETKHEETSWGDVVH